MSSLCNAVKRFLNVFRCIDEAKLKGLRFINPSLTLNVGWLQICVMSFDHVFWDKMQKTVKPK